MRRDVGGDASTTASATAAVMVDRGGRRYGNDETGGGGATGGRTAVIAGVILARIDRVARVFVVMVGEFRPFAAAINSGEVGAARYGGERRLCAGEASEWKMEIAEVGSAAGNAGSAAPGEGTCMLVLD